MELGEALEKGRVERGSIWRSLRELGNFVGQRSGKSSDLPLKRSSKSSEETVGLGKRSEPKMNLQSDSLSPPPPLSLLLSQWSNRHHG